MSVEDLDAVVTDRGSLPLISTICSGEIMRSLPKEFQPLFPSSPVDQFDVQRDHQYLISTLLKTATMPAWRWLFQTYSTDDISEVIKATKNLRKKDVMIWASYFDIPVESIACTQTKSPAGLKSSWTF